MAWQIPLKTEWGSSYSKAYARPGQIAFNPALLDGSIVFWVWTSKAVADRHKAAQLARLQAAKDGTPPGADADDSTCQPVSYVTVMIPPEVVIEVMVGIEGVNLAERIYALSAGTSDFAEAEAV